MRNKNRPMGSHTFFQKNNIIAFELNLIQNSIGISCTHAWRFSKFDVYEFAKITKKHFLNRFLKMWLYKLLIDILIALLVIRWIIKIYQVNFCIYFYMNKFVDSIIFFNQINSSNFEWAYHESLLCIFVRKYVIKA